MSSIKEAIAASFGKAVGSFSLRNSAGNFVSISRGSLDDDQSYVIVDLVEKNLNGIPNSDIISPSVKVERCLHDTLDVIADTAEVIIGGRRPILPTVLICVLGTGRYRTLG